MRLPSFASSLTLITMLAVAPAAAGEGAGPAPSGLPDLAVRVLPKSATCAQASLCSLVIHVLNEGDATYEGFVSVFLDLHAPAVAAPPPPGGAPCTREDYGKFRCDLANVTLEPGGYAVIEPEFLFTATAYQSANACASLKWTPKTLVARDRLLAAAIEASGQTADALTKAAGLRGDNQSSLLASLVGRWGEGDAVASNDSVCASLGIARFGSEPACSQGEIKVGGTCTALAQWCPSNRRHLAGPARCVCPAELPSWNNENGRCEAGSPTLACAAADGDPHRSCRCPPDKPVLNAAKSACVPAETAASAPPATIEETEPAAKPSNLPTAKPRRSMAEETSGKPRASTKPQPDFAKDPERKPAVRKGNPPAKMASAESKRHCRGLQRWGRKLQRCVPLPIFLIGRLLSPG